MAVPFRARWHLPSIVGYCVLVALVVLGLGAMHGGASAAMAAGHHPAPHVSTTAAYLSPAGPHVAGAQEVPMTAAGLATLAGPDSMPSSSTDHGLVVGCVLALTGVIGVVLARVLARFADGPALRVIGTRNAQRTVRPSGLALPRPWDRFFLCVLRT